MTDFELTHRLENENSGLSEEEINKITAAAYAYEKAQPPTPSPVGMLPYESREDMMIGLHDIPDEIGKRFDAHGIAKGMTRDQVVSLNRFLTSGIDPTRPFHSMPLKGAETEAAAFGAAGPLPGAFVILGAADRQLTDGIKYVLVNNPMVSAIPLFSEKFPGVTFIPISEAEQKLSELLSKINSSQ